MTIVKEKMYRKAIESVIKHEKHCGVKRLEGVLTR